MKLKPFITCSVLILGCSTAAFANQLPSTTFYNSDNNTKSNLSVTFKNCVSDSEGNKYCKPQQTIRNIEPGHSKTVKNDLAGSTGSNWITKVISASIGKAHSSYGENHYENCAAWTNASDNNKKHSIRFDTGGTKDTVFCDSNAIGF